MVVETNANVRARVTAHEVIVDGELSGEVFCLGRTRISRTGRVVGEISTEVIVLDEGAYFEGRLEMSTALAT